MRLPAWLLVSLSTACSTDTASSSHAAATAPKPMVDASVLPTPSRTSPSDAQGFGGDAERGSPSEEKCAPLAPVNLVADCSIKPSRVIPFPLSAPLGTTDVTGLEFIDGRWYLGMKVGACSGGGAGCSSQAGVFRLTDAGTWEEVLPTKDVVLAGAAGSLYWASSVTASGDGVHIVQDGLAGDIEMPPPLSSTSFRGLQTSGDSLFALVAYDAPPTLTTGLVRWPILPDGTLGVGEMLASLGFASNVTVAGSALGWLETSAIVLADQKGRAGQRIALRAGLETYRLTGDTDVLVSLSSDGAGAAFRSSSLCRVDTRNAVAETIFTSRWYATDVTIAAGNAVVVEGRDYDGTEPPSKTWAVPLDGRAPKSLGCSGFGALLVATGSREVCWATDQLYCFDLVLLAG